MKLLIICYSILLFISSAYGNPTCSLLFASEPFSLTSKRFGAFKISQSVIKHIWEGDYKYSIVDKKPRAVLAGGLHSLEGFEKFKRLRGGLRHHFEIDASEILNTTEHNWYFMRTDPDTGVIYLKLDRSLFHSKSWRATRQAEIFGSGGRGWKVLFPENLSKDILLSNLGSALDDKSTIREKQKDGSVVYKTFLTLPKANYPLKLTIRTNKEKDIVSVYPAWEQGSRRRIEQQHVLSLNTFEIPKSERKAVIDLTLRNSKLIKGNTIENLLPKILQDRPIKSANEPASEYHSRVAQWITGLNISKKQIENLIEYFHDPILNTSPFTISQELYHVYLDGGKQNKTLLRTAQVLENIITGLKVLEHYDRGHNTKHSLEASLVLLYKIVVPNHPLYLWQARRIQIAIIETFHTHPRLKEHAGDYIRALSYSPSRAGLFSNLPFEILLYKSEDQFYSQSRPKNWVTTELSRIENNMTRHYYAFKLLYSPMNDIVNNETITVDRLMNFRKSQSKFNKFYVDEVVQSTEFQFFVWTHMHHQFSEILKVYLESHSQKANSEEVQNIYADYIGVTRDLGFNHLLYFIPKSLKVKSKKNKKSNKLRDQQNFAQEYIINRLGLGVIDMAINHFKETDNIKAMERFKYERFAFPMLTKPVSGDIHYEIYNNFKMSEDQHPTNICCILRNAKDEEFNSSTKRKMEWTANQISDIFDIIDN